MHFIKQSKFELMRWGRERAKRAASEFGFTPITSLTQADEAPTMEVDGVLYREGQGNCADCAFGQKEPGFCGLVSSPGYPAVLGAFADACFERNVIYIRAS